jgi:hypothetical protein
VRGEVGVDALSPLPHCTIPASGCSSAGFERKRGRKLKTRPAKRVEYVHAASRSSVYFLACLLLFISTVFVSHRSPTDISDLSQREM